MLARTSGNRCSGAWLLLLCLSLLAMRIGGMGRIYDTLVKTKDGWKIKKHVLANFIQRQ